MPSVALFAALATTFAFCTNPTARNRALAAATSTCPGCADGGASGPLCPACQRAVDDVAAAAARKAAAQVFAVPLYRECPGCEGHGDVQGAPSLRNPIGLIRCPRCAGTRTIVDDREDLIVPFTAASVLS